MDTYSVEFRLQGSELVPSNVTKILRLSPCRTIEKGTQKPGNRILVPLWSYDGVSSESNYVEKEWESLEDGLEFLLNSLWPKRSLLYSNFGAFDMYWWCGHFQHSFDGGPTFSPALLRRLAEFGAKLILSNYCSSE